ncbi:hypothetical protein FA13DRAFT_1732597 [Coprinellus micaceus]|uniref:Uncharacterized protein n=1 Tax=Coprinellus micaceus TaxID=71717 RepID=A0A4Y7TC13_COPMI|nr:hypothetical protein FA13DRAFT_1732597 [Coprinellus micaceus]
MSSQRDTPLSSKDGVHRHLHEGTAATDMMMPNGEANEKGEMKADPASPKVEEVEEQSPVKKDSREYFLTFYSQFSNIIMISTFTGGVQAAVLSFMNDLLSGETLRRTLFHRDEGNPKVPVYSAYSLGLMLGLLAVALNLTVAAIAAVNAALACHFSLYKPDHKPPMEARIVFCMFLQFMASGLAGISLVMLCAEFDLAFMIVAAVLFFAGIAISAFHLISLFGRKWLSKVLKQPLHAVSLVLSTVAFCFEVGSPSPSSWFTIATFGTTVTFHMMAVLHAKSPRGDRPRRLYAFVALVIACMWVGCVAATLAFSFPRRGWSGHLQEKVSRYVIASLAGVEALVLLIVGVVYWVQVARCPKEPKDEGSK